MSTVATTPMVPLVTPPGETNGYDSDQSTPVVTVSKLSQLQRHILRLALENRTRENRTEDSRGADLYHAEILIEHFGFEAPHYREGGLREHIGDQHFHPDGDEARFASARASISRAVGRLRERGLIAWMQGVNSHWSGVSLTAAGIKAATTTATGKTEAGKSVVKKPHPQPEEY